MHRKPPANRLVAAYPGHIWAYDVVEDALADGTPLRILTVMDEFTREGLALDVDTSASAERVIGVLSALVVQHGAPGHLRSDNGPEFVATAVQRWLTQRGIQTLYIDAGKPWQHGKEERFNGTVRDEGLNMHCFASLAEAWVRLSAFQKEYITVRPHSSLGISPRRCSRRLGTRPTPRPRRLPFPLDQCVGLMTPRTAIEQVCVML